MATMTKMDDVGDDGGDDDAVAADNKATVQTMFRVFNDASNRFLEAVSTRHELITPTKHVLPETNTNKHTQTER